MTKSKTPLSGVPVVDMPNVEASAFAVSSPPPTINRTYTEAERLAAVETWMFGAERRFNEGAKSMSEHRYALSQIVDRSSVELEKIESKIGTSSQALEQKISESNTSLRKQIDDAKLPRSWLITTVLGLFVTAGGVLWQAAKYPERGEFREQATLITENHEAILDIKRNASSAEVDWHRQLEAVLDRVKTLEQKQKTP